ncbi:hypothetical protein JCM11491_002263 [Sporobolomyces phaffii]
MASINSLPPEIIQLIVDSIEQISQWERETGREYGVNLPGSNSRRRRRERARRARLERGEPATDDDDDDDDDRDLPGGAAPPANAAREAIMAMFDGMFGLPPAARPARPRPAPPAPPAQAPADPPRPPASAPRGDGPFFSLFPNGTEDDSDEAMPPLESIAPPAAQASASARVPPPQSSASTSNSHPTSASATASPSTASRPMGPVASGPYSLAQFGTLPPAGESATSSRPATPLPKSTSLNAKSKQPARRGGGNDSDSDDMPPLESISQPSTSQPPVAPGIGSSKQQKQKKKEDVPNKVAPVCDSDGDELPPLEPISNPAAASTSAGSSKPKQPVVDRESDWEDEPPHLASGPNPSSSSATTKKPVPASRPSTDARPADPVASALFSLKQLDDFSIPSYSRLSSTNPPVPSTSSATAPGDKGRGGEGAAAPQKEKEGEDKRAKVPGADASDSDDMPPLESIARYPPLAPAFAPYDPAAFAAYRAATSTSAAAVGESDDDGMAALERLHGGTPSARAGPTRWRERGGGGGGGPSEPSDDDDDDYGTDDDDDDDDDEDYYSDDDDDEYSDDGGREWDERSLDSFDDSDKSSIASDECTFQDGVPHDPLLPLLFVSRPFLHAARKALYRKVHLTSAYQARLLLDSIKQEKHAARTLDEEVVKPQVDYSARSTKGKGKAKAGGEKNALGTMIKSLNLELSSIVGMGRGGGRTYIELIEACERLESLVVKPMFVKSATEPLLKALNNLPNLKLLDIQSNNTRDHPFLVTTPRIFDIQRSSPHLENLTVQFMKSGEEGDSDEEEDMWELVNGESDEIYGDEGDEDDWRPVFMVENGKGAWETPTSSQHVSEVRRKGLKKLSLYDFDVPSAEISLLLRDSTKTLDTLRLMRPGPRFTRFGFASTLLIYGHNLTTLDLGLPSTWYPHPALTGPSKAPPPAKPKGYTPGKPSHDVVSNVEEYRYILDAIMPYLPNLKILAWSGPQASTAVFSLMPASLGTVVWSHCPAVQPKLLAKLLNKTMNRTTTVTQPDGSKTTETVKTKVARGLHCLTVAHDDMTWSGEEISDLETALTSRDCCLHLSSDTASGLFGGLAGAAAAAALGGGGAGGGGIHIPLPLGIGRGGGPAGGS